MEVIRDENGLVIQEEWKSSSHQLHRVDGPAWRQWQVVDGVPVLIVEDWYLEGKMHRLDGPSGREWQVVDGVPVLIYEDWCVEGKCHRVDGPSFTHWEVDGTSTRHSIDEHWHLHGRRVDPLDLHRAAGVIQRWFLRRREVRERVISSLLQADGMIVFPGLMGLLRRC